MNNEVTVAQILEREGWDPRRKPKSRSRLQLFSVMAAVVIGCGIAALLVRVVSAPTPEQRAETIVEDVGIIQAPRSPTGVAGPEATPPSDDPKVVPGGADSPWYEEEDKAEIPPETTTPTRTSGTSQTETDTSTTTPTTTTSKKPTTTTTTKKPCILPPLIC